MEGSTSQTAGETDEPHLTHGRVGHQQTKHARASAVVQLRVGRTHEEAHPCVAHVPAPVLCKHDELHSIDV